MKGTINGKFGLFVVLTSIIILTGVRPVEKFSNDLTRSKVVTEKAGNRYLSIYFPPGFSPDESLKVVYMLDGNALFGIKPDLEKLLNRLIQKKRISPIVLVGVHSTFQRTSDLVPYYDKDIVDYGGPYRPNASLFSKELHEVIIPHMEKKYGVSKSSDDRALYGFSHGGLFTLWEASGNGKSWGMIGSMSPSFWVKDYQVLKDVTENGVATKKVWFDVGTGEWQIIYNLIDLLSEKGLVYGRDQFYYEDPGAEHLYRHMLERLVNPLIAFCGSQDYEPIDLELLSEFIPSRRSSRVFKRINPMVELANGMKFSAATEAQYTLLNEDAGTVKPDGHFEFNGNASLKIRVNYQGLERTISVAPERGN
jgi:enterochelin esterase-like enzyme